MPFWLSDCANQTPCMFAWSVDFGASPATPHDKVQTRTIIMREAFIFRFLIERIETTISYTLINFKIIQIKKYITHKMPIWVKCGRLAGHKRGHTTHRIQHCTQQKHLQKQGWTL